MEKSYANIAPTQYASITRSVRVNGYVTSVRLEKRFWDVLDELARSEGTSTPRFISQLYGEVLAARGEVTCLASLLRVVCATWLGGREEPALRSPVPALRIV
jgi:predicted DNA-binding ribbon-helix-helix protein